jgi:hypothetical protein
MGVHPTQLYESGLNFLLFLGLSWLYGRKKFDGQVFAPYLIAYAVLRGLVEIFRGDYPPDSYTWRLHAGATRERSDFNRRLYSALGAEPIQKERIQPGAAL